MNLRILAAASAALVASAAASAALAADVTKDADVKITVNAPQSVTKSSDMDFGTITRPATGQPDATVTLAASANPSVTVGAGASHSGTWTPAHFVVAGDNGSTVTLTTTHDNPGGVTGFTLSQSTPDGSVTLDGTGKADLYYGGSFTVTATTATGTLAAGAVHVTISYN